jgi:trehalose 2-sulfotransferase
MQLSHSVNSIELTTRYLICALPRSGSWLLAEGLEAVGFAGRPREWFAPEQTKAFAEQWMLSFPIQFSVFLSAAIAAGTTKNGVFGAKVHWYQMEDLLGRLRAILGEQHRHPQDILGEAFPSAKYIWLRRRDIERQAISYARASQSNKWWDIDGLSPPAPDARDQPYNFITVHRLEALLHYGETMWGELFRTFDRPPMQVFYEEVSDNLLGTVRRVLEFIEIPVPTNFMVPTPRLKKQGDAITELWLAKYRKDKTFRS